MNCPHCGAENAADALQCALCGQPLTEQPEQPAEKKKSPPVALIATVAVVAVALVVVVLLLVRQAIPAAPPADPTSSAADPAAGTDAVSDAPQTGETTPDDANPADAEDVTPYYPVTAYTSPALVPEGSMDTQVGAYNDSMISNRDVNYYYWGEYYYLLSNYGNNITLLLDPYTPLGEQLCRGSATPDHTWQDYLLECAESTIGETHALVAMAEAEGVPLSDQDAAYLAQTEADLPTFAEQAGYTDVDAYLQASYGPGASVESFLAFLKDSVMASSYAQHLYSSFHYTEEEIRDYYTTGGYADQGLAQDEVHNVHVRHILIQTRTDDEGNEDWDATLAAAEDILALWQATPTEDNFAQLADEYSEDPGSNTNGGLYSNVRQGQMVPAFNDWCFDTARQIGDTGIVQTNYGYHIMYFSGRAERPAWMETVEDDMRREAYSNAIAAALAQASYALDYSAVVLAAPAGLYE